MTVRYYDTRVRLSWEGTAIRHDEPTIRGQELTRIHDIFSTGARCLVVVEATDEEHIANELNPAVESLDEAEAQRVADRYRPEGKQRPGQMDLYRQLMQGAPEASGTEDLDLSELGRTVMPPAKRTRVELKATVHKIQSRRLRDSEPAAGSGPVGDARKHN